MQVHGGRAVIGSVLAAIGAVPRCVMAEAGEFTRRALGNGKIDLVGAEALADLLDAETDEQRKLAMRGRSGALQAEIAQLREGILQAMALIEAGIDFSDEGDIPSGLDHHSFALIGTVIERIEAIQHRSKTAERLRAGLIVVLAGPVNAGKSTLLNALAGRDVAIVSAHAGTTRDRLDIHLDLGGWPVTISDTAGLRQTDDEVERQGIARSLKAVAGADVVLSLSDADSAWQSIDAPDALVLKVRTKIDSHPVRSTDAVLCVSARTGEGLPALLEQLETVAAACMRLPDAPVVTHERQRLALADAHRRLSLLVEHHPDAEIAAEELRMAAIDLDRLIGAVSTDEVLGEIFSVSASASSWLSRLHPDTCGGHLIQ